MDVLEKTSERNLSDCVLGPSDLASLDNLDLSVLLYHKYTTGLDNADMTNGGKCVIQTGWENNVNKENNVVMLSSHQT